MKKQHYILLIIISICYLSNNNVKASHLMGGDLTYKCLSEGVYEVHLTIIGDCRGIWSYPSSLELNVKAQCTPGELNGNNEYFTTSLWLQNEGEEISTFCTDKMPRCHYPLQDELGIIKYEYKGVVDLTSYTDCHQFNMHYVLCCRNLAIGNIELSGSAFGALKLFLDKNYGCFDSPQFSEDPTVTSCADQPFFFSSNIEVNENTTFNAEATKPIRSFNSNYEPIYVLAEDGSEFDPDNPFPVLQGGEFNVSDNGTVSFIPNGVQTSLASVKASQFYNETLISTVMRDFQFVVIDCNNSPPTLLPESTTYNVCAHSPLTVNFSAESNTGPESQVLLESFNDIHGSNFALVKGVGIVESSFNWIPRHDNVREEPYHFTVRAFDDSCPLQTSTYHHFKVYVEACLQPVGIPCENCLTSFAPLPGKDYVVSAWVKEMNASPTAITYEHPNLMLVYNDEFGVEIESQTFFASGIIIDGWQRIFSHTHIPSNAFEMDFYLQTNDGLAYFDDIRFHPVNAKMESFVYDPNSLRLTAILDENNYATFYEYDNEGNLIRVKRETERGVFTITEHRQSHPINE